MTDVRKADLSTSFDCGGNVLNILIRTSVSARLTVENS